jgi:hypothetical protein
MAMLVEHVARIRVRNTLAVLMAFFLVVAVRADVLLSTDFETDPVAQGWTTDGSGVATWTTNEAYSGTHSLAASNQVSWLSPLLNTTPLQWYRLSFRSKGPGPLDTQDNPGSIGYAYWAAQFFDTNGNMLSEDQYSAIFQSSGWVTNEFRIRAKNLAGPGATLVPVQMKIRFRSWNPPLFIDDVLVETTTPAEVAQWGDAYYDSLPAKLAYVPKDDHGSRLPLTMNRLRTGQNLRIVMLGDSVEQDTANSPFDAWLERLYPGAGIQVISSTIGGTGLSFFQNNMQAYVFAYQPDLLCIGGIDNPDDMTVYQSVVDQVRANDAANNRTTEMLMLTKQWSPNIIQGAYFLSPGITELDQAPANNPGGVPSGFQGDLLNFCAANNIEYLDLTGVASQFIYGPAAAAGVGPPSDANGDNYSFWMRDFVHSSDNGKMIQGRMLEAFFAPTPTLNISGNATTLNLAWPLAATGYHLETTSNVGAGALWTSNATLFSITNGQNILVTNPPAGTNQLFFRLHKS